MGNERKIDSAVSYYARLLRGLDRPPGTLKHAPDSRVASILHRAGYKRSSQRILKLLADAFEGQGMATLPLLSDPDIRRDTKVYFFPGSVPVGLTLPDSLFQTEKELEDFLEENFDRLQVFSGLRYRERQFRINDSKTIDILCEETESDRLVGIELKRAGADQRLTSQMSSYMKALQELAKREGRVDGVRGVVITGQPTPGIEDDLKQLCERNDFKIDWYYYNRSSWPIRSPRWG